MSRGLLELRCAAGPRAGQQACLLAVITHDPRFGYLAALRQRTRLEDEAGGWWTTHRSNARPLSDFTPPYLLLACKHEDGLAVHVDTVPQLVRDTPTGRPYLVA